MPRITFLFCVCAIVVSTLLPHRVGGHQDPELLVLILGQEIKKCMQEGRISGADRQIVAKITLSFLNDPPLKTIDKIMKEGRRNARLVKGDDGYWTYEDILKDKEVKTALEWEKIITITRPSPALTYRQAHDLKRIVDLKAALRRHDLWNTDAAAGMLYKLIIADIRANREG